MLSMLTLQWPLRSEGDYDWLIETEEALEELLGRSASVDGHDMGSGEMNIFIETDHPVETFIILRDELQARLRWDELRAAHRPLEGEQYSILWPKDLLEFDVR